MLARLVLIAVAVLAVAGCGASGKEGSRSAPTAGGARPRPGDGVVFVRARHGRRTSTGTGFVVDRRAGWILTSDHAVEASPAITVTDRDGRVMHGRLLARAQCHDFAVVKLHPVPPDLTELPLAGAERVRAGQQVTSISYAATGARGRAVPAQVVASGPVTAVGKRAVLHHLLPPMHPLIAHGIPLNGTASGSPLLNSRGQVVGLNTLDGAMHGAGSHPGQEYALSSSTVYGLLRDLHTGRENALAGWRAEHRCHGAMARLAGVPAGHEHMRGMSHGTGMHGP